MVGPSCHQPSVVFRERVYVASCVERDKVAQCLSRQDSEPSGERSRGFPLQSLSWCVVYRLGTVLLLRFDGQHVRDGGEGQARHAGRARLVMVAQAHLVYLACLVSWLKETNRMNQINQMDERRGLL